MLTTPNSMYGGVGGGSNRSRSRIGRRPEPSHCLSLPPAQTCGCAKCCLPSLSRHSVTSVAARARLLKCMPSAALSVPAGDDTRVRLAGSRLRILTGHTCVAAKKTGLPRDTRDTALSQPSPHSFLDKSVISHIHIPLSLLSLRIVVDGRR